MARAIASEGETRSSAQTRERIVEAARQLMTEQDTVDVPIAEITQRADANIASVSYHFGGREGLMLSIARADASEAMTDLARLMAMDLSPAEKIHRHVIGIIRAYFRRPYLHRLLHKLLSEGSPDVAQQVGAFFVLPVAEAEREILEDGMVAGSFRKVDHRYVNFAIEGACAKIFLSAASREALLGTGVLSREIVDAYARSTADLFVLGLLTPAAHGDWIKRLA